MMEFRGRQTDPGRFVLVAKSASGRETVISALQSDETVRSVAWKQIERLAELECEKFPALTKSEARIRAMDSPEGEPFRDFYRHPDASLPVGEWVSKHASAPAAAARRARVEQLAAERMVAKGITIEAARCEVWDVYPELRP